MTGVFVEVGGARLFCDEDGAGDAVVFIHGNMVDGRMWEPQVAALRSRYRVVRIDLRGYGRSPWLPAPYSDHGDILAVLRSLGIERSHLVGLSMGGNVALEFAIAHPAATTSLVVVTGGVPGHELSSSFEEGFAAIVGAARKGDHERAVQLVMDFESMRPANRIPRVRTALLDMLHAYTWQNLIDDFGGVYEELDPPTWERLEEIACPALVICGELEIEDFRDEAAALARRIPRAQLVEVRGAGHMVSMEKPAAFNEALLTFLGQIMPRK